MTHNLFLDANVYLSFYLFGKDDLIQMDKLVKLIDDEEITLYVSTQLRHEISRNREAKIAEGFSTLKKHKFGREFPNYCSDYEELADLREGLKTVGKQLNALVEKVEADIESKSLRADKLITSLLDAGTEMDVNSDILDFARARTERGDPPWKKGSMGDALHWECLLVNVPYRSLYIVTLDGDFSSPLNSEAILDFLDEEWKERKSIGRVHLFRSISGFFKDQSLDIELSIEQAKDELVQRLKASDNFEETHEIISKLSAYDNFTLKQKRGLFWALVHNSQVGWIAEDDDVKEFFVNFGHGAWNVDYGILTQAAELIGIDIDIFTPF
jgi:hypothetical protein